MSKRKWRWVTRDEDCSLVYIWKLYRPRPTWSCSVWGMDGYDVDYVCVCTKEFKKLTGITVSTDKPVKVEFSAKVVE